MNKLETDNTIELLDEIRNRIIDSQKEMSLANQSTNFSIIEDVGERIRSERKKQNLTMNELCELSEVAYATLSKIEKGDVGISLTSLQSILYALGLKLWVG